MDGWSSKSNCTANKSQMPEGVVGNVNGAGVDEQDCIYIWSTHTGSSHSWTQHPARVENGEFKCTGWRREGKGGETYRGCGHGRLANQVGVRNRYAEAQPRARLLHCRHRRLEVAGERGGGGRRRGRGVGGLRGKWRQRMKERKKEGVRIRGGWGEVQMWGKGVLKEKKRRGGSWLH